MMLLEVVMGEVERGADGYVRLGRVSVFCADPGTENDAPIWEVTGPKRRMHPVEMAALEEAAVEIVAKRFGVGFEQCEHVAPLRWVVDVPQPA